MTENSVCLLFSNLIQFAQTFFCFLYLRASYFVSVRTTPSLSCYYCTHPSVIELCRRSCTQLNNESNNIVNAIVYSKEGFQARTQIQHQIEKEIHQSSCIWILVTCGFVLCCGCCPCCQQDVHKLNETNYCTHIAQMYPDKIQSSETFSKVVTTATT
jgi:hypothetical protein